jgi:hypothetical protein
MVMEQSIEVGNSRHKGTQKMVSAFRTRCRFVGIHRKLAGSSEKVYIIFPRLIAEGAAAGLMLPTLFGKCRSSFSQRKSFFLRGRLTFSRAVREKINRSSTRKAATLYFQTYGLSI